MNKNFDYEAIARAICVSCDEVPTHKGDAQGNQYRWQDYIPCAQAAVEAMLADDKVRHQIFEIIKESKPL